MTNIRYRFSRSRVACLCIWRLPGFFYFHQLFYTFWKHKKDGSVRIKYTLSDYYKQTNLNNEGLVHKLLLVGWPA